MSDTMFKPTIIMHGPVATHDMPCAMCRQRKAVLDLSNGVFGPCTICESAGYAILKRRLWVPRWLFRLATEKHP